MNEFQKAVIRLGDAIDQTIEETFGKRIGFVLQIVPLDDNNKPVKSFITSNIPRENVLELWQMEIDGNATVKVMDKDEINEAVAESLGETKN